MRLITPEEDNLLDKISYAKTQARLLENEIMVGEAQLKGNKKRRNSEFTTFTLWLMISSALMLLLMGYLIAGDGMGVRASLGMAFAAGGFLFVALGSFFITIVYFFRYKCRTGKSAFWRKMALKNDIDNIYEEDMENRSQLNSDKSKLKYFNNKIAELTNEYEELKLKLDNQDIKEEIKKKINVSVETGNRNDVSTLNNYQVQFNWLEQKETLKGRINKLRVNKNLLINKIDDVNSELQDLDVYVTEIENGRKNMSIFSYVVMFLGGCMFLYSVIKRGENIINISYFELAVLTFVFGLLVIFFVNLFTMPIVKDNKFAISLGERIGSFMAKTKIEELLNKSREYDSQLIELDNELDLLEEEYSQGDKDNDLPYEY